MRRVCVRVCVGEIVGAEEVGGVERFIIRDLTCAREGKKERERKSRGRNG